MRKFLSRLALWLLPLLLQKLSSLHSRCVAYGYQKSSKSLCKYDKNDLSPTGDDPDKTYPDPKLRQGIQTNFAHEALRKWGCYFFCLLRWAEEISNFRARNDFCIVELFVDFVDRGWLTNQCKVLQPVLILNHLVGANQFTTVTHEALRPLDRITAERVNHGTWPHFILHVGTEVWDSWANPSVYTPVNWRRII